MSDLYWIELRSKKKHIENHRKTVVQIKAILTLVGNSVRKDVTRPTFYASKVSVKPNVEELMTQLAQANHIQRFEKATQLLWLKIWRKVLWQYNLHNYLMRMNKNKELNLLKKWHFLHTFHSYRWYWWWKRLKGRGIYILTRWFLFFHRS